MKVFGLQGGLYRLARLGWRRKIHDDPDVQLRLHALGQFRELHEKHGLSVRAAARIVGVPLSTLYEWRNRLRTRGLGGLRPRSRRPRRTPRKKQWERNKDLSPEAAQKLADAAVDEVRAHRP